MSLKLYQVTEYDYDGIHTYGIFHKREIAEYYLKKLIEYKIVIANSTVEEIEIDKVDHPQFLPPQ